MLICLPVEQLMALSNYGTRTVAQTYGRWLLMAAL